MDQKRRKCIVFSRQTLLPHEWFQEIGRPLRTFNPTLLRISPSEISGVLASCQKFARWLFAYRVVAEDGKRKIALCLLDEHFHLLPESKVPLSDLIAPTTSTGGEVTPWFADPRLYRLQGRIFLYWNSGWHEPMNQQFLQELDAHTLLPQGKPRELILQEPRQKLEKNWMFFGDDPLYAIYSVNPHRVLRFSLEGDGPILFEEQVSKPWDTTNYEASFGPLRGGAPPIRSGDRYYSVCHSLYQLPEGVRYVPAVYAFGAEFPFLPIGSPKNKSEIGNPFGANRILPKLNPAVSEVVYPCGAAIDNGQGILSYGINDEHCAISILPLSDLIIE